jgi:hypothetical protein
MEKGEAFTQRSQRLAWCRHLIAILVVKLSVSRRHSQFSKMRRDYLQNSTRASSLPRSLLLIDSLEFCVAICLVCCSFCMRQGERLCNLVG